MKAILEFNLDNTEDHLDYRLAAQALPMGLVLWEIMQNLRRRVEVRLETSMQVPDSGMLLDTLFSELDEILDDHGVDVIQVFNEAKKERRKPDGGQLFRTIEDVENAVCKLFNTTGEALRKRSRKPGYVIPRQTAMALSVLHFPQITYADIGWHFGRYDHSTVSHALRAVKDKIDTEKDFRELTALYFKGLKWPV